jgi:hypothetical protein
MSALDKNNKTTRRDRLRLLLSGINLHFQNIVTMTIGGVVYQLADIKAAIAGDIAASDLAEKGYATWLQQVDEERASHALVNPLVSGVKQFVRLEIGDTDAVQGKLADFGMSPRKVPAPKPVVLVAAAAKAKATRVARGTRGAVQKKSIHGAPAATPAEGTTPTK